MSTLKCTKRQRKDHYHSLPYFSFRLLPVENVACLFMQRKDIGREYRGMSYQRRYKLKDDRFGLMALTLREKAGLVQAEVASVLGVSERTIRHWEGGTAFPTADNLKKLIEIGR